MPTLKESNYMTFTFKTEKLPIIDHQQKKSSAVYCINKTRLHFNEIVATIPRERGLVVVFGEKDNKMILLETFRREADLRSQFRKTQASLSGSNTDRFNWMVDLLKNSGYKKLRIYAALAA